MVGLQSVLLVLYLAYPHKDMDDYSVLLKEQNDNVRAVYQKTKKEIAARPKQVKRQVPRYLRRVFDSKCQVKIKAAIQRAMEKDDLTYQEIVQAATEHRMRKSVNE